MAKKYKQTIEIDIIAKGASNAENAFKGMLDNTGRLGKASNEVLKDIEKINAITAKYGKSIPIDQAKELERLFGRVANNAGKISEMDSIKIFGPKELKEFQNINRQIELYNKKLEEQKKIQEDAQSKRTERINQLKNQKTATLTEKDGSKKSVKLDSIKGKWNNSSDLEKISQSSSSSKEEKTAALAVLQQINKAENDYNKTITESAKNHDNYKDKILELKSKRAELATTTRNTTEAERTNGETVQKWAEEMAKSIHGAIDANQKMGNSAVDTSNKLQKQEVSLGKAVKSLFSWAEAWRIGSQIIRESVRTVTEMDKALTGMAMVTGDSREEVNSLIPRIQDLAKETSTAMTEVADLITEYTRQGRSLEESFILAEETAKAAKIAGISAADSIQYMTSAINGFNLAATEATRVSDIFANVAATSATNYEQLAISLSKVSAQANLAGMSIEYTTALLAKGIEVTQEAPESIGTALKTIIARMRELSDYGKTLEDGGSVNKVENALAAAGIQLRDVNGEFRNLEDIFNELGPKWDSLNTMQQQAIAQAVAGTRQQSRFVAIMQDWARTQELAAEAQDSAGASAAQYSVYAQGMEAAMTNLKTSWQEFIQSLTSSKMIIGIVNGVNSLLDGITKFLEGGGEFTKVMFLGFAGILAVNKVIEPLKKALGLETNKEKIIQAEKMGYLAKQAEINEQILKQEKAKKEFARQQAKEEADKASANLLEAEESNEKRSVDIEQEIEARKSELTSSDAYSEGEAWTEEDFANDPKIASLQKELELNKQNLEALRETARVKGEELTTATQELENASRMVADAENTSAEASKAHQDALAECNNPVAQNINYLIKGLEKEKEKIKLAKAEAKTEKEKLEYEKQEEKITKRIINLEKKKAKALKKTQGIFSAIGSSIGTTILGGLQSVFDQLGPIGDLLNDGLNTLINWGTETLATAATEFMLAKIKKESVKDEKDETKAKMVNSAITTTEIVQEELVEKSKEEQVVDENLETGAKMAGAAATGVEIGAEKLENVEKKKNTKEEKKGLGTKIASAIVNAAKSAAEIPVAGWVIALALLALAGVAGVAAIATSASGGGGASDSQASNKIANQQTTIYNTKRKNSELQASTDELEALMTKDVRSSKEEDRIKELADGLRNQNEAWKNLTDSQVLEEAKREISMNNDIIARNIDSNYNLALTMENFTSAVAQQALVTKMSEDQKKLIKSKAGPGADTEAIEKAATGITEAFVANNSERMAEMVKTQETSGWDSVIDFIPVVDQVWDSVRAFRDEGFWRGMDELLLNGFITDLGEHGANAFWRAIPVVGEAIAGFVDRDRAKKERERLDAELEKASHDIVDFAIEMESAGDDVVSQLKKYNELIVDASDTLAQSVKSEYSTVAYLSDAIGHSQKTADALDRLSKAGLMTSESLLKIVDAAAGTTEDAQSSIDVVLNAYENGVTGESSDSSKREVSKDLDKLRKKLKLDEDATITEIKEAYIQKYAKTDESGNIVKDKKGNIKMRGNNKNRTAIYNALLDIEAAAGEYANLTESQLKALNKHKVDVDITEAISDLLTSVDEELGIAKDLTDEQAAALRNDKDFQAQASATIMDKGYAMIDSITGTTGAYIKTEQERIAEMEEEYNNMSDKDSDAAVELLGTINAANADLEPIVKNYNESIAKLTEATLQAAGYMDAATGDEMLTSAASTRERIVEVRDKIGSGEFLDSEDYAFIRDDLAPQLKDIFGESFDLSQFYKDLEEGNSKAFSMLDELYKNQQFTTDMSYERSLATYPKQRQEIIDEYNELIENAETEEDKEALEKSKQWELDQLEYWYDTQKAQQEAARKFNTEMLGLSAEELKLQNARTKLEIIEAGTSKDIVSNYHEKIEAQKILLSDLENSMANKWSNLEKTVNDVAFAEGKSFKDYIKIQNGKITIDEEWYNKLSGNQKQMIDDWKEGASEIAEETYETYQSMTESTQEYFEAQIDSQSEIVDAYKSQLEEEQESLQDSLDKRREMYEKYFDALEEEENDDSFEEEQMRLQNAIASLSGATDASSLQKLKEYQEELAELEDEQRATERERRRDAVMTNFDNQSESIDQYYEDRLSNEQRLWDEISSKSEKEIENIMTTYNEDYKNATDLNKQYMLLSYKELHRDLMAMMGNAESAGKAEADLENYKKYMEKYASDPSIGAYNPKKTYSKGGIVDYTGLAMVHGSSSRPEAFLNSSQTQLFSELSYYLEEVYKHSKGVLTDQDANNGSVTIDSITIAVDAQLTNDNVYETGQSLADALLEGLRRTGVSVNMKK